MSRSVPGNTGWGRGSPWPLWKHSRAHVGTLLSDIHAHVCSMTPCTHMHTQLYTQTASCVHTQMHNWTPVHTATPMHTLKQTHSRMYSAHTHTPQYTHLHTPAYVHAEHTCTYCNTYSYTYTHPYTHAHIFVIHST